MECEVSSRAVQMALQVANPKMAADLAMEFKGHIYEAPGPSGPWGSDRVTGPLSSVVEVQTRKRFRLFRFVVRVMRALCTH
eukprot:g26756.t1